MGDIFHARNVQNAYTFVHRDLEVDKKRKFRVKKKSFIAGGNVMNKTWLKKNDI